MIGFVRGLSPQEDLNVGIIHKPATKKELKDYVKTQLSESQAWAERALIKIFEFQTDSEQETASTHCYNDVGFTGADAEILTSFAKGLIKYKRLTPKQMEITRKKMPKYWKQIIKISDPVALDKMVRTARLKK